MRQPFSKETIYPLTVSWGGGTSIMQRKKKVLYSILKVTAADAKPSKKGEERKEGK